MRKDRVSALEARRAIYIDFEGLMNAAPVLLGAYWLDDDDEHFIQYVFEPKLASAAAAKAIDVGGTCVYADSLESALIAVLDVTTAEDRLLVEWSSREDLVVTDANLSANQHSVFSEKIRDAKVSSKRWKNRFYRDVEFKPNDRGIKNCLTNFMNLAGMPVPTYLRPAAARIRYIIAQIEKRGSYDALTPVAKAKWTKLLSHNEWDCAGTRKVLVTACDDLERAAGNQMLEQRASQLRSSSLPIATRFSRRS